MRTVAESSAKMGHLEDNPTADQPAVARARPRLKLRFPRLLPVAGSGWAVKVRSAYRRWLPFLKRGAQRDWSGSPALDLHDRIFTELAAQRDFDEAVRLLLRQLIRDPQLGFAAVVESVKIDDQPLRSRGLCQDSRRSLTVGNDLRDALTFQSSVTLRGKELRDHELFQKLAICDRRKVEQLYVLRLGEARHGFDVLITSDLFPADLEPRQRMAFTENTVALLSGLWTKNRAARTELAQHETDEAFAELRIHLESANDNPRQTIARYIDELRDSLDVDRVSLLVPHGTMATIRLAVGGPAMPRNIEKTWREHENLLAAACIEQGELMQFDTAALRSLDIDTLIGGATTSPIMIDGCVVALLFLTTRSGWPTSVRGQRLVQGCAECLQETIAKMRSAAESNARAQRSNTVRRNFPTTASPMHELLATMTYEISNPGSDFVGTVHASLDPDFAETPADNSEPRSSTEPSLSPTIDETPECEELPERWRVLLADDDPISRLIGREILHKHGHQVTVVRNGADAEAAIHAGQFDVMLLDLQMPDIDWHTVVRQIRAGERMHHRRTYLIALTDDGSDDRQELGFQEADIDVCLVKPVNSQELRSALGELTGNEAAGNPPRPMADHPASGIQYAALLARVEGDQELAKELLEMFVTGGSKYLADIRAAIENYDIHNARNAALQLSGAARNIGADTLAAISQEMDDVDAARIDDAKTIYRNLQRAIEQLQEYAASLD